MTALLYDHPCILVPREDRRRLVEAVETLKRLEATAEDVKAADRRFSQAEDFRGSLSGAIKRIETSLLKNEAEKCDE